MLELPPELRHERVSQRCCGSVQVTQAGCFSGFLHEGPKLELLPGQETHVLQPETQSGRWKCLHLVPEITNSTSSSWREEFSDIVTGRWGCVRSPWGTPPDLSRPCEGPLQDRRSCLQWHFPQHTDSRSACRVEPWERWCHQCHYSPSGSPSSPTPHSAPRPFSSVAQYCDQPQPVRNKTTTVSHSYGECQVMRVLGPQLCPNLVVKGTTGSSCSPITLSNEIGIGVGW